MISPAQIHRRARLLGVDDSVVVRDHVMCHVLAALTETGPGLVFRGGTALSRVHWPDHRMSEDLDFVTGESWESVGDQIERSLVLAAGRLAAGVTVGSAASDTFRFRRVIRHAAGEILVDVVRQTPIRTTEARLDLPYDDLPNNLHIPTVAVEEILADKWFMLEDRDEPRDLFDLWTGLVRRKLPFAPLVDVHLAKYGYRPAAETLTRAGRLRRTWDVRLGHQVRILPDFDAVIEALEHALRSREDHAG